MKPLLLAALAAAISGPALAADLPNTQAPAFVAPAVSPTWTGFFAGFNLGYGFSPGLRDSGAQTYYANTSGDTGTETHGAGGPTWANSSNLSGIIGGGQIGYNFQINPLAVVGVETDFQGTGLSGSSSAFDSTHETLSPFPVGGPNQWPVAGTANVSQRVDWYGTLRARAGVPLLDDALLIYGTGGLAYGKVRQDFNYVGGFLPDAALGFGGSHWNGDASSSSIRLGWTAGAGVEWKLPNLPNWSVKAEYLYTDLGPRTVDLSAPAFRNSNGSGGRTVEAENGVGARWHTVRVGLNYHF